MEYTKYNNVSADSSKTYNYDVSDYAYMVVGMFMAYSTGSQGFVKIYIDDAFIETPVSSASQGTRYVDGKAYDVTNASKFTIELFGVYTMASAAALCIYAFK